MVYIEVQDKKLKFGTEKNELQSASFDWYSIDQKSFNWYSIDWKVAYQQKISKRKKLINWPFEAQIASYFFQYLKDIIN